MTALAALVVSLLASCVLATVPNTTILSVVNVRNAFATPTVEIGDSVVLTLGGLTVPADSYSIRLRGLGLTPVVGNTCEATTFVDTIHNSTTVYSFVRTSADSLDSIMFPGPVLIPEGLDQNTARNRVVITCATNVTTAGSANYVAHGFRTMSIMHIELTRLADGAVYFAQNPTYLSPRSTAAVWVTYGAGVEYYFPDAAGLDFLDGIDATLPMGMTVSLSRSTQSAVGGWTSLAVEQEFALNVPLFPGIEATPALKCFMSFSETLRDAFTETVYDERIDVPAAGFPGALVLSFSASTAPTPRAALVDSFALADSKSIGSLMRFTCTGMVRQRNAFPRLMEDTSGGSQFAMDLDFISRTPRTTPLMRVAARHGVHSPGSYVGVIFKRRARTAPLGGVELASLRDMFLGLIPQGSPTVQALQTDMYVVLRVSYSMEYLDILMLGGDSSWDALPATSSTSFPSLSFFSRRRMDASYGLILCEQATTSALGPCQFTDPESMCGIASYVSKPVCARAASYVAGDYTSVAPYLPVDAPECTLRDPLRPPVFTAECASWRVETAPGSGEFTDVPACPSGCYASRAMTYASAPQCLFSNGTAVSAGLVTTYCPESLMRDPTTPCTQTDRCVHVCATSSSVTALDAAIAAGTSPLPALTAARCGSAASPYSTARATWPACDWCGTFSLERPLFCVDAQSVSGAAATQFLPATAPAADGDSRPRASDFYLCNGVSGSMPATQTVCEGTSQCVSEWECSLESDVDEPTPEDRVWLPCSDPAVSIDAAPCGPACAATQKRSLRCAVYDSNGAKILNAAVRSTEPAAALLNQICASAQPTAPLPRRSQPCEGTGVCTRGWRCRPLGAPVSESMSCSVNASAPLGLDNGGFEACPTAGCSAKEVAVSRSVACFLGDELLTAASCADFPRPASRRQCGPATADCVSAYPPVAPCVEDLVSRSPLLCKLTDSAGDVVVTPIRVAVCLDPATGAARPDDWCWPVPGSSPPTEPCTALPECVVDRPLSYPAARWVVPAAPSPCLTGRDFACKSVAPVALACETSTDGGSTWVSADLSVCASFISGPAPAAAVPCPSDTSDPLTACGFNGFCALNDYVSPVDSKTYKLARGTCVCALGYFGDSCEQSFAISHVTAEVSLVGETLVLHGSFRFSDEAPRSTKLASRVSSVIVTLEHAGADPYLSAVPIAILTPAEAYSDEADAIEFHASLAPHTSPLPAGLYRVRVRVPPTATMADVSAHSADISLPSLCDGRCQNRGTCVRETGRCACLGGWTGALCELSPCTTAGCNEYAGMSTCDVDPVTNSAICRCSVHPVTGQPFYTGPKCTTPGISCAGSEPCRNDGMRIVVASSSYAGLECGLCNCSWPWAGKTCVECTRSCFTPGGAADSACSSCVCNAGYTGPTCGCRFATVRLDFNSSQSTPWLRAASVIAERTWLSSLETELGIAANGHLTNPQAAVLVTPRIVGTTADAVNGLSRYSVTAALYSATACISAIEHAHVTGIDLPPTERIVFVEPRMDDTYTAIANLVVAFRSGSLSLTDSLAGLDTAAGMSVSDVGCDPVEEGSCPTGVPAHAAPDPPETETPGGSDDPKTSASAAGLTDVQIAMIATVGTLFVAAIVSVVIGCLLHSSTAAKPRSVLP